MRAVSHEKRAQSMSTLTIALERLVKMERQAFKIDAEAGGEGVATVEERVKKYEQDAAKARGIASGKIVNLQ